MGVDAFEVRCIPRRTSDQSTNEPMTHQRKMPRRIFGMVKTNWRWGTSWQTEVAIQSALWRTRRWWQAGQKWRPLQVKARNNLESAVGC